MYFGNELLLLLPYLMYQHVQYASSDNPVVDTNAGLIEGLRAENGDYSMFLGIPYARINEANPFGDSLAVSKFDGVFQAFDDSALCPQWDSGEVTTKGSLDCLRLNIYVPRTACSQNRLPVLFWIHGGKFEIGNAGMKVYGPKFLIKQEVILVTINYRLGIYGFMCLRTPEVPGNQGLKDQLSALRWIRENIESFGGDANRITLSGESAGGRSVDLHLMSPQDILYNNVIMESGTSVIRETILEPDLRAPFKISKHLGFHTNETSKALSFLVSTDPQKIVFASHELDLIRYFRPCIEEAFDNVERFITDYSFNLKIPKANRISVLIGFNNNEQVARYATKDPSFFDGLNVIYDRLARDFDFDEKKLIEMEEVVRQFYLGDRNISQGVMWNLIDFDSDFTYGYTTERTIDSYQKNGAGTIYYYLFSYVGGRNYYKDLYNVKVGGVSHADELGYLFDMTYYKDEPTREDQLIIDRITALWGNFIKYSNPTPVITDLLPIKWEPSTRNLRNYLEIDSTLKLKKRPFHKRMAFWKLFYTLNWKKQKGFKNKKGDQK